MPNRRSYFAVIITVGAVFKVKYNQDKVISRCNGNTDESGVKINGCKHLFWTCQTPFLPISPIQTIGGARLLTGNSRKIFTKRFRA